MKKYQLKIKRFSKSVPSSAVWSNCLWVNHSSYEYIGKFTCEKEALNWAVSDEGKEIIGGKTLLNNVEVITA